MIYIQSNSKRTFGSVVALSLIGMMFFGVNSYSENEYAGLWVGRAALSHVSEVAVPLDEDNIPIAPDPNSPTKAHDEAYIRLILHVNGSGQVNLLRDVAILSQNEEAISGGIAQSESDYVLVTDDRLYIDFPEQKAVRIASAVFDFGDNKATEAVDKMIESVISNVASNVIDAIITATDSDAKLRSAEDDAEAAGTNAVNLSVMNVNDEFIAFLRAEVDSGDLDDLDTFDIGALETAAANYYNDSFYGDDRGIQLASALTAIQASSDTNTVKATRAHNLVSRYLDFDNDYQRFITGLDFGDMIVSAAQLAADAVINSNDVSGAVLGSSLVSTMVTEASEERTIPAGYTYRDTAATNAIAIVMNAVIDSATSTVETTISAIKIEAESAGLASLENNVARYQVFSPTDDYNAFITSESFAESVGTAARAAALAAVKEAKNDVFHDEQTLKNAAKIAAVNAITIVYAEAARARQTELPLDGEFGSDVDPLMGTVYLPANHPTNPFRHRRHPDHTVGFNICRNIEIDFDSGASNQLTQASFGVDQITGTYREEIFGLHKPLGPNSDIGLKVEGEFELNRVSHIDTLNSF